MTLLEAEIQNFKSFRAPAAVSLVSSAKSKKGKKGKGRRLCQSRFSWEQMEAENPTFLLLSVF